MSEPLHTWSPDAATSPSTDAGHVTSSSIARTVEREEDPERSAPVGAPGRLLSPDVLKAGCPSRPILQHLTGRWGALTMAALGAGRQRFSEVRRRVDGISDRMLSQTLGQLERDGMVARTVLSTIPPKVEYQLTSLGAEVLVPLMSLISLVEQRMPEVVDAQRAFDTTHPTP